MAIVVATTVTIKLSLYCLIRFIRSHLCDTILINTIHYNVRPYDVVTPVSTVVCVSIAHLDLQKSQ